VPAMAMVAVVSMMAVVMMVMRVILMAHDSVPFIS